MRLIGTRLLAVGNRRSTGAAPAPVGWTPAALGASLALWLDAHDTASITLNGSTVSQWNDKSGNGFDLVQPTAASQPLYVTAGLNGKNTVRNVSIDKLQRLNTPIVRNVGGATVVAVGLYPVASVAVNAMLFGATTVISGSRAVLNANNAGVAADRMGMSGRRLDADAFQPVASSTPRIQGGWFVQVGVFNYASAQANHFTNGAQDITNAAFQTAGNTSDTDGHIVMFGRSTDDTLTTPNGTEIAEALIVHAALSTANRQKLEGYLAHKWGLTANLPAGHPYKTTPPTV